MNTCLSRSWSERYLHCSAHTRTHQQNKIVFGRASSAAYSVQALFSDNPARVHVERSNSFEWRQRQLKPTARVNGEIVSLRVCIKCCGIASESERCYVVVRLRRLKIGTGQVLCMPFKLVCSSFSFASFFSSIFHCSSMMTITRATHTRYARADVLCAAHCALCGSCIEDPVWAHTCILFLISQVVSSVAEANENRCIASTK